MAVNPNDMVNYGILNTQGKPSQVQQVNVQPDQSIGMLSAGLKKLFGTSGPGIAANAIHGALSSADPKAVANSILGGGAPAQQTAMMGDGGNVAPNYGQPKPPAPMNTAPETQLMQNNPASLSIPNVYDAAKDVYKDNPTMARLATAQAIQESRLNGTPSTLASQHNNLFGIKGKGSAGSVTMMTHEFVNGHMIAVPQQFAAYASPRDSIIAHKALMSNKRYRSVASADSVESGARALQDSGYATDPNYANDLIMHEKQIPQDLPLTKNSAPQDL